MDHLPANSDEDSQARALAEVLPQHPRRAEAGGPTGSTTHCAMKGSCGFWDDARVLLRLTCRARKRVHGLCRAGLSVQTCLKNGRWPGCLFSGGMRPRTEVDWVNDVPHLRTHRSAPSRIRLVPLSTTPPKVEEFLTRARSSAPALAPTEGSTQRTTPSGCMWKGRGRVRGGSVGRWAAWG